MPKQIADEVKQEALRLRREERLGIDAIRRQTGLSVGTLSLLFQDDPLSDEEVRAKMSGASKRYNPFRKYVPNLSKLSRMTRGLRLTTQQKGEIAEKAVALRLKWLGYEVWRPDFEGSRVDFIIARPGVNKYVRLQVKWARREKFGRPLIGLRNGEHGKIRRLTRTECDFYIGFDLETDTAFVLPISICEGKNFKACDEKYAEAWHLLGI